MIQIKEVNTVTYCHAIERLKNYGVKWLEGKACQIIMFELTGHPSEIYFRLLSDILMQDSNKIEVSFEQFLLRACVE